MKRKIVYVIFILAFVLIITGCGKTSFEGKWQIEYKGENLIIDLHDGDFDYYVEGYRSNGLHGYYKIENQEGNTIYLSCEFVNDDLNSGKPTALKYKYDYGKLCSYDKNTKECEEYFERVK